MQCAVTATPAGPADVDAINDRAHSDFRIVVEGQQNDADLQPGCQRDQRDCFPGRCPRVEFFDKGHGGWSMQLPYWSTVMTALPGSSPNAAETLAMPLRIVRAEV